MARRRFFVHSVRGDRAELTGEAAKHLRQVLRAERGQVFEISDNQNVYLAEIQGFGKDQVHFRVLEKLAPVAVPVRVRLLVSLIKFDRFEWVLEKSVELGVEAIIPVSSERSGKGLDLAAWKRLERWRRIVLESSQQARRAHLPEVSLPLEFERAINLEGKYRYFLDEQSATAQPILAYLPDACLRTSSDIVCILLGPEGGWTEQERARAAAAGWMPVSLGPQVLRAETAAIAALAIVTSAWDFSRRQQPGLTMDT